MVSKIALTLVSLALALVAVSGTRLRAKEVLYVGHPVPTAKTPIEEIDHSRWTDLLSRYVDASGSVSYARWHESCRDREALTTYLEHLSNAEINASSPMNAKLAFWINAYNALTIAGILHHYPVNSIREIADESGGFNIWDDYRLFVSGQPFSLNQIEHDVLRLMGEPRIHFAVVCASKGCPMLPREAYTTERLDQQLTESARAFFAKPENLFADKESIRLSSIIDWYRTDFGNSDAEIVERISPWLPSRLRALHKRGTSPLSFGEYDWSLNEVLPTPSSPESPRHDGEPSQHPDGDRNGGRPGSRDADQQSAE